jgi:hypothetical protein
LGYRIRCAAGTETAPAAKHQIPLIYSDTRRGVGLENSVRLVTWGYAACWYSLIRPVTACFQRTDDRSVTLVATANEFAVPAQDGVRGEL